MLREMDIEMGVSDWRDIVPPHMDRFGEVRAYIMPIENATLHSSLKRIMMGLVGDTLLVLSNTI